jgi:hypothetical protein
VVIFDTGFRSPAKRRVARTHLGGTRYVAC